ncbi:uncharacterized protein ColSpa_08917 [Colletotrichum spaethianum]|uniref:Uncharacterized protein n=1 Tax=Colletotrichum spaethianum TaxID=700344 RepID=A0AA37UJT3_9PEZI|nr:uncharacterized protein ColSpa_08917 [Colletotrichum spaethianum]GKT48736.1 hypothetical protein ColSpa_08917 [Colletotrichum spaethianum]
MQKEVMYAFDKNLRFDDGEEWKEVTAFVLIKRIVTIMNAVGFVGMISGKHLTHSMVGIRGFDQLFTPSSSGALVSMPGVNG